ncbi:hypothetical protein EDC15_10524 [Acetobacter aceti NBRC 14818]|uniref:Lipoprotein n=2 Tax=Acetobacter aceti TaxID=435 RepID=A0AB33IJP5_ACEAC|nr:hypothetical protein [Acetobacter aceti]TCS33813.1 hypothetical protein EDC15_10524 [Acetobacter aceti NBRC 14818]BCK76182.1 hypothetical protein EMQ_1788 [Acetobacter aceti NBRC 14818]GAN57745.1 hypothetical protein Abac_018_158 [Acetobacter aceti NBRC 14818]
MLRSFCFSSLVLCAFACAPALAAGPEKPPEASVLLYRMTTEPQQYGGLSGSEPKRLLVGFHYTDAHTFTGEFGQLDESLRPIRVGTLYGSLSPATPERSASCSFRVVFPDRSMTFNGACEPETLSGSITTRLTPIPLNAQLLNALSPDVSVGQYWLTKTGFRAALKPAVHSPSAEMTRVRTIPLTE